MNDAIVYRAKLKRDGNFVFPFWKDDKNKTDIPDAVVFCRSGLIGRITDQYCHDTYEGMEGVRDEKHINNAIRPLLEENAKNCYLTWLYIDNNDGKLPDYITTFDNWKEFVKEFYICRKLSTENIPKSGIHTAVHVVSGAIVKCVDISRRVNVNVSRRLCPVHCPKRRCSNT